MIGILDLKLTPENLINLLQLVVLSQKIRIIFSCLFNVKDIIIMQ